MEKNNSSSSSSFCLDMIQHGYLIGLTQKDYEELFRFWEFEILEKISQMEKHQHQTKQQILEKLYPIFVNFHIVGGLYVTQKEEKEVQIVLYIRNQCKQYSQKILDESEKRKMKLKKMVYI